MEQLELFDSDQHGFYLADKQTKSANIVLAGGSEEMIKITADSFYVRGVPVQQGPGEASAVYEAFKQWMVWASLTRNS